MANAPISIPSVTLSKHLCEKRRKIMYRSKVGNQFFWTNSETIIWVFVIIFAIMQVRALKTILPKSMSHKERLNKVQTRKMLLIYWFMWLCTKERERETYVVPCFMLFLLQETRNLCLFAKIPKINMRASYFIWNIIASELFYLFKQSQSLFFCRSHKQHQMLHL